MKKKIIFAAFPYYFSDVSKVVWNDAWRIWYNHHWSVTFRRGECI